MSQLYIILIQGLGSLLDWAVWRQALGQTCKQRVYWVRDTSIQKGNRIGKREDLTYLGLPVRP